MQNPLTKPLAKPLAKSLAKPLAFSILALALQLAPLKGNAAASSTAAAQAAGGVTLSLTTSGFQFTPLVSAAGAGGAVAEVVPIVPQDQGFSAAVALTNHTGQDIKFALGVLGGTSTSASFEFSVYNSNGKLVWDSLGTFSIPLIYMATLHTGDAFRGSVFVPLFPNGKPLPAGTYTLEVSLFGTPAFSATSSFVVNKAVAVK